MGHILKGDFNSKSYARGKNGREKDKRKLENDVIGLDDEGELQQAEGESRTTLRMVTLDARTFLGRQRTREES